MAADSPKAIGVDPQEDKYLLQVTAGPSYEDAERYTVQVNGSDSCCIDNDLITAWVKVNIRGFHGLPPNSPPSNPYFAHPLHKNDRYSISFTFISKVAISGEDVVMGFDFDHPVRDRLPPGFKTAMKIATNFLDPGIYSDPYSDLPYLYGAALSSFFAFRVGDRIARDGVRSDRVPDSALQQDEAGVIEEGGSRDGLQVREQLQMPSKAEKRRKFFLKEDRLKAFTFEKDRVYQADFFNPYLDFANFALKLPGISISVAKYIDEKTHCLRYVLKNRRNGDVFFVIVFKLLFGRELEETLDSQHHHGRKKEERNPSDSDGLPNQAQLMSSENQQPGEPKNIERGQQKERAQSQLGDAQGPDPESGESNTANTLAESVLSVLAAIGFGQEQDETASKRDDGLNMDDQISDEAVEHVSDKNVEEFLRRS